MLHTGHISKLYPTMKMGYVKQEGSSQNYPFSFSQLDETYPIERLRTGRPCSFELDENEQVKVWDLKPPEE